MIAVVGSLMTQIDIYNTPTILLVFTTASHITTVKWCIMICLGQKYLVLSEVLCRVVQECHTVVCSTTSKPRSFELCHILILINYPSQ